MGRILCIKHGPSPIDLVCAHIATSKTMPTHCVVTLELDGDKTEVRCCEACATELRAQTITSEEDLELALGDTTPMCAVCLSADLY